MKIIQTLLLALVVILFACSPAQKTGESEQIATKVAAPGAAQLSDAEAAEGWQLLFDGTSTEGWHSYLKEGVEGWKAENGELISEGGHGDLITDAQYENFELSLEFKISPGGNSGIIYRVVEDAKYPATYMTGPEYQLIDDNGWKDSLTDKQKTGANYDVDAPAGIHSKPPGEYNQARILVNGSHVEHWLNGQKVVEYELWSPEWEKKVANSKWKTVADYGRAKSGKIALQDHGDGVTTFRNIKIRPL